MSYCLFIFASLFSFAFSAQVDLRTLQKSLCAQHTDCRINVVPQPMKNLGGQCKGMLLETFQCQIDFFISEKEEPKMLVKCLDKENKAVMDQAVPAEVIRYKLITIMNDTGRETIEVDEKDYFLLDNPTLKISLARGGDSSEAQINFVMADQVHPFTQVSCELKP